ncbi:hypothetical protein B4U80_14678, partial [Leptotrombidium deliense]
MVKANCADWSQSLNSEKCIFESLQKIGISICSCVVKSNVLQKILDNRKIKVLNIRVAYYGCSLTDWFVPDFPELRSDSLEVLSIKTTFYFNRNVLMDFKHFPNLKVLDLADKWFTDSYDELIASYCPNLEHLRIVGGEMTDLSLTYLLNLT